MSSKTIADLDEGIKAQALAVLKAQGLSLEDFAQMVLNTALKKVAAKKSLDLLFAPSTETDGLLTETSAYSEELADLKKLPGFGLWADRADMKNPAEWVRNLRRPRFQSDL